MSKPIVKELCLYSPHSEQLKIHNSKARFRVSKWGRQSGKSTGALNDLVARGWEQPGSVLWFISPTYPQAKIQYRRLVSMLWPVNDIMVKKNQTELRVKLLNQTSIVFKSGESYDNLRSETLDGVVIDEVRDQNPELWPLVIRPMLATTGGWASFISTPRGFDQFYEIYDKALHDKSGNWECFSAPSTCNPLFTKEEAELARDDMTELEYQQEIEAEFVNLTVGRTYKNYSTDNESLVNPFTNSDLISKYLPIVVALDFNISPMSWTLGQINGLESYWFDEIRLMNSSTQEAALELVNKVKNHPNGIVIVGDATAKARQRAAAAQSDYDILCQILDEHKIKWVNKTPDSNPPIKDRVNTVNVRCKSASNVISFRLHPTNCKYLKTDLERITWKQGADVTLDPGPKNELTHSSDGVGYALCVLTPVRKIEEVGAMRIISR